MNPDIKELLQKLVQAEVIHDYALSHDEYVIDIVIQQTEETEFKLITLRA